MQQLYGWTRDEAVGACSHDLLQTEFPQPLDQINGILIKSGEWEGELRHTRKDGSGLVVASHWAVHAPPGQEPTVIEVNNDITGLKEYEQERERLVAELQRSNDELAKFAHTVSHDLQAPLRGIRNYAGLLSKRFGNELGDTGKEFINLMVDSAESMQKMISGLLDYARAGGSNRNHTIVDTNAVVQGALTNLHVDIIAAGAEISAGTLPAIEADPVELLQVFQNLISNAVKYRVPGRRPQISIEGRREGPNCVFSVRDNGMGIRQDYLDQIFTPLTRLHGPDISGSGLGLAICRRIVERNKGGIWVESNPGEGSTFMFTWPAVP